MRADHERLFDEDAGPIANVDELRRFAGRKRNRLFAEHMLAGVGRANRPRYVKMIRQRDVDSVDIAVREHLFVGRIGLRDPSEAAALLARAPSRDAIASTRVHVPFCIAGITLFVAIRATPRTPQRTFESPSSSPAFARAALVSFGAAGPDPNPESLVPDPESRIPAKPIHHRPIVISVCYAGASVKRAENRA